MNSASSVDGPGSARDSIVIPPAAMASLKEESPAETGISDVPVFTEPRESSQSTPASIFTSGSQGPKPEGDDILIPPSAAAATVASVTILSDAMPATPFSLPATPPPPFLDVVELSAKNLAVVADTPSARPLTANGRLNDTPPESADEPYEEFASEASHRSEPVADVVEVAAELRSNPARLAHVPETTSTAEASPANASTTNDDANASNGTPSSTPQLPSARSTHDPASPSESTSGTIASRRPVRMARQAKAAAQTLQQPAKPATKPAPKPASSLAAVTKPAPKANATPVRVAAERRVTRLSGVPSESSTPQSSLGKRRRRDSEKNATSELPRELRRLQDTKEFAHVDEQPIVYTVWSNGKYVPANAAGEPLPDKTSASKSAKSGAAGDGRTGESAGQSPGKKAKAGTSDAEDAQDHVVKPVQKRVKKWLNKGLYAGQSMPENPTLGLTTVEKKALTKLPELSKQYPPNKTLPMPIFNGLRMLIQGRDFKMPFDVFNPLPPGQPKPIKYGRFNKNRFVGEAHTIWKKSPHYDDFQLSKCVCKPETGCDEDCQNRIMLYECNDMICNVGSEKCNNREFQRLAERTASKNPYNIGVEVFKTPDRGHGIRANRCFRPGQIIMEYIGEIITEEESDRRMNELYKNNACYYLMSFDQSLIIDGTSGSIARFVNHSCSPNCRMIKWIVSGQPRIALFAGDRPIMTGEELTYDYNFDPYSSKNVQACLCGSENCRGVLGPRKSEKAMSKAATEKAASDKAKAETGKSKTNKPGKRKLDVYSMDDDSDNANTGAHVAKKIRISIAEKRGPGRPRKDDEPPKSGSKAASVKRVTTTKAALEALAAGAAKEARAAKAAKAKRAARAAKAAEVAKALEASKKAKLAKLSKHSKAAATANKGKGAKGLSNAAASKTTKAAKNASTKTTKAVTTAKVSKTIKTATTATATKATKPAKLAKPVKAVKAVTSVKAARAVKVTKTTKGLKAAKVTKTVKITSAKSVKPLAKKATSSQKMAGKVSKAAKLAKPTQGRNMKDTEVTRAATPQELEQTEGDIVSQVVSQATPMAKAVAKAAKEAAKAAKSGKASHVLSRKSAVSSKHAKNSALGKTTAIKRAEKIVVPAKRGRGRPRLTPKVLAERAAQAAAKAASKTVAKAVKKTNTETTTSAEEAELAAQLNMEVTAQVTAEISTKVTMEAPSTGGKTASTHATSLSDNVQQTSDSLPADPPRRKRGRPRKVVAVVTPSTIETDEMATAEVPAIETQPVPEPTKTAGFIGFFARRKAAADTTATKEADRVEISGNEDTERPATVQESPSKEQESINGNPVDSDSAEDVIHVA